MYVWQNLYVALAWLIKDEIQYKGKKNNKQTNKQKLTTMSGPMLPIRTRVLLQLGSVLMSVAHVTTEGHADDHSLHCNVNPCWYSWTMLLLVPYWCERAYTATEGFGDVLVHSLLRARSWFEVLLQLGSMLMSVAHLATKDPTDIHGLCCQLKPCQCLGALEPPGAILIWVACTATWIHCDVCPDQCCHWGPCPHLWFYCSWGLYRCPWPMLPPKAKKISMRPFWCL